jgi:hypothetical protein
MSYHILSSPRYWVNILIAEISFYSIGIGICCIDCYDSGFVRFSSEFSHLISNITLVLDSIRISDVPCLFAVASHLIVKTI